MACYNHPDRQSIGVCKAYGRSVCMECTAEVGMSIACKNRCEDQVRLTDSLIADNIRNAPYVNKAVQSAQSNRFILPALLLGTGLLCLLWAIHDYRKSGGIGILFSFGVILIIYALPRMIGAVHASRTQPYPSGFCQRCGYDMRGNLSGKCPECGRKT